MVTRKAMGVSLKTESEVTTAPPWPQQTFSFKKPKRYRVHRDEFGGQGGDGNYVKEFHA
jgi:hypothetical protein